LARDLDKPLAVLNIGGVANVTWIGSGADQVIAFDTGPGNALLDDWVWEATGRAMDENGRLAGAGKVNETVLAALLDNPWLDLPPPKSLDRNDFDGLPIQGLAPADGAATLAAFTAGTVRCAQRFFPAPVSRWLVCGGGRRNPALMVALRRVLDAPVEAVEAVGWDGDALEAQAFAFLAVRALYRLPLSLPGTTGVPRPLSGGRLHQAPGRAPLGLGGDG
jgi:anhydro-N-acetylmuramic acid kinase